MKHSKPIQLRIASPCSEQWNEMPPNDKGRHCAHCQKTVIDFTGMTDAELFAFFSKQQGSVCGRFNSKQLHRDINIPFQPKSRLYRLAIACSLTLIFTQVPESHARVKQTIELFAAYEEDKSEAATVIQNTATIDGVVVTSERKRIQDAIVMLKQNDSLVKTTTTSKRGQFAFKNLQPGTYDVYIKCDPTGYQFVREIHERVSIGANDTISVSACLAKEQEAANEDRGMVYGAVSYSEPLPLGSFVRIKMSDEKVARKENHD